LKLGVKFFCEGFARKRAGVNRFAWRNLSGQPIRGFLPAARCRNDRKIAGRWRGLARPSRRLRRGLRWACRSSGHTPKPMEHDAGDGVHHSGECGERKKRSGRFRWRAFRRSARFSNALGMRHGADVPDVGEDFAGVGDQESGEFAIMLPSAGDGLFVDGAGGGVEEKRLGRDVGCAR